LAVLEKHNVAATFFVSGVCAKQNKDEIRKINDAGHEIGLHGYRHVPYDMPYAEMVNDLYQAISTFKEIGVTVKGFRAPWLIANENAYRVAQRFGLKYVSNVKAKKALQRFNKYSFVQLPIYLDDESLLQKDAVDVLLHASKAERVFGFHLIYVRQNMHILEKFLTELKLETATLSQIADGKKGIGLSFDIAYLSRLELVKKLFS
jgi:peptidoglycan/xylan/chitin deacetylase (PgdA/CDA1 family)